MRERDGKIVPALDLVRRASARCTQWVRRTFRDDYINDLIESEEIVARPTPSGGLLYILKDHARDVND